MNKVITINLCGAAYQLEEGGYDALRAYLESASVRLQENPDRDEIISDIEGAIGEKFRALLGNFKTVVTEKEVAAVIAEMGPIEAEPGGATKPGATGPEKPGGESKQRSAGSDVPPPIGAPRRLYCIQEGAMWSGVCNGLGAYLNIDPTFIRLAFVFLTLVWGTGVLVYIVLAIVVPTARTPEEKAAASGTPVTAQEYIRRAQAGYYEALKGFPDRHARREWRRRFKREMRANAEQWRQNWRGCLAPRIPCYPWSGLTIFLISVLRAAVMIVFLCALVSILSNGTVFGRMLPDSIPVWLAVVILCIVYGVISSPLKVARRAYYWNRGAPGPASAVPVVMDTGLSIVIFVILICLVIHYFPHLRDAAASVPSVIHSAFHDIRAWWKNN